MNIPIYLNASEMRLAPNRLWRGVGMVSGNNSSRLLLDYRALHKEAYFQLLHHIFSEEGLGVSLLKLEMGADINSSSGTEPCVMRSATETVDVTRGAGYQLAADARTVCPNVQLDMLFWSEPRWVSDSDNVYEARYRWYKETLCAAWNTYGLRFQFVSANRNERAIDADWIIYLHEHLQAETDAPYDFSQIRIVAADEENAWHIAEQMLANPRLRDAISVIGSHYTSHSTPEAKLLAETYGKELWFSEGCPPASYTEGIRRFDGSGLLGINGILDVANRILAMVPLGEMTLYEFQPVVAAYYDGVTYCHKQLITANEPWSGHYELDAGYYMALHFSRFLRPGWAVLPNASHCNGEKGGDGHALVHTTKSFLSLADPATGDFTTIIINETDTPQTYALHVLGFRPVPLHIWETYGSVAEPLTAHLCKHVGILEPLLPQSPTEPFSYEITLRPASMVTLTTLSKEATPLPTPSAPSEVLELPYHDNFSYPEQASDFLASRGGAPYFTTDQGGAFEITSPSRLLVQQILPETKAEEWGGTPLPTTNLGDDRWFHYGVRTAVRLAPGNSPNDNYAGIGLRYSLACNGMSGYSLLLFEDNTWQLRANETVLRFGSAPIPTDASDFRQLCLIAHAGHITAWIDDMPVADYDASESGQAILGAGRMALYSSYDHNAFSFVEAFPTPTTGSPYIRRIDDTDLAFSYEGEWEHRTMNGFISYRRTCSIGKEADGLRCAFSGTSIGLFGENASPTRLRILLDDNILFENYMIPASGARELFFYQDGLPVGEHVLQLTVLTGTLVLDGAQMDYAK